MKFRWRLLLFLIPFTIIPVIIIAMYSGISLFNYLTRQALANYDTILTQVGRTIDTSFNNHAMTLADITMMDNFYRFIDHPPYKSAIEERLFPRTIGEWGNMPKGNTIRRAAMAKMRGDFFIIEFDRISLLYNTDFKIHKLTEGLIDFDMGKLMEDPLYQAVTRDRNRGTIFGALQDGVLSGFETDNRPVFIYPFYRQGSDTFVEFIITVMEISFMDKMYRDIDNLKYGTLFIVDRNGSVLSSNHPNPGSDYYEFDYESGRYTLGDDEPYDEFENMSFREYQMLITTPDVLQSDEVKAIIELENGTDEAANAGRDLHRIEFNEREYLMVTGFAQDAECSLYYFHPIQQILAPVYRIVTVISIVTIVLIIASLLLSILISTRVTRPVNKLTYGADRISSGDYSYRLDTDTFSGEFKVLGNSFNHMSHQINEYRNNMEEIVKKRTSELEERTNELESAYEELHREHEDNNRELLLAQKIQEALIPTIFPSNQIVNLQGLYAPMERLGGDLYDVFKVSETRIDLLILDVVGHGVPAALVTTMAKISFFTNSKLYDTPDQILRQVNNEMVENLGDIRYYFTVFYASIDVLSRTLTYSNASHPPAIIIHRDSYRELQPNSAFVGVKKGLEFTSETVPIEYNDRIILYTDGVTEARNIQSELYDEDRFKDSIMHEHDKPLDEFIDSIYGHLTNFIDIENRNDDIAILVADLIMDKAGIHLDLSSLDDRFFHEIEATNDDTIRAKLKSLHKALDLFNAGDFEKSTELLTGLKNGFNRKDDNFRVYNLLAYNWYRQDDMKKAIKYWQKALVFRPNDRVIEHNIRTALSIE
jgi:serine phosphatase RsbU (regulator of sigma subunit)